mgnify:CR=1 FL=1
MEVVILNWNWVLNIAGIGTLITKLFLRKKRIAEKIQNFF